MLEALQTLSIGSGDKVNIPDLRDRLSLALRDFNSSATRAIKRLYAGPKRENGVHPNALGMDEGDLDKEEADDGPNETVFLVYLYVLPGRACAHRCIVSCSRWRNSAEKHCSFLTRSKR